MSPSSSKLIGSGGQPSSSSSRWQPSKAQTSSLTYSGSIGAGAPGGGFETSTLRRGRTLPLAMITVLAMFGVLAMRHSGSAPASAQPCANG